MQSLSVVLDRGLESKLSDLLTKANDGLISGILIGHRTAANVIQIVHVAKTVKVDEAEEATEAIVATPTKAARPSKKSTNTQETSTTFDEQSTLHHVRQAVRMLPGGLDIVGFFVMTTNKKQNEITTAVNKTLRLAYKSMSKINNLFGGPPTNVVVQDSSLADGRMLVLSLDPSPSNKKPIGVTVVDCRPDVQASAPSTAIPFSYQNLRWRCLSTRLMFDVPSFVPLEHDRDNFLKQFAEAIRPWARRLWSAELTINGALKSDEETLVTAPTGGGGGKGGKGKKTAAVEEMETDTVEFYFPDEDGSRSIADANVYVNPSNGAVSMHIRGTLYSLAFVNQKATVAEGVRALKTDVLRSLYGRCELHYDGMTVLEGEELDPVAVHQFPRRVTAPLNEHSDLLVTDYLFEGDVKTDAVASFRDLLGVDTAADTIDDTYEKAPGEETLEVLLKSGDDHHQGGFAEETERMQAQFDEHHGGGGKKKGMMTKNNRNTIVYFVLALMVAILALAFLFMFGKRG